MRNLVLLKIDLESGETPLSEGKLVATFTMTASHLNTQDAVLVGTDGKEIALPPGVQYRFEQVDLSQIQVRSKAGEVVYVVGHTA